MKVAYLFNADLFEDDYGTPINKCVLSIINNEKQIDLNTKIFLGDLCLCNFAYDIKQEGNETTRTFNQEKFGDLLASMICPNSPIWKTITKSAVKVIRDRHIYVVCFESIEFVDAIHIDLKLKDIEYYVGAIEIADTEAVHWGLFTSSLIPKIRIKERNAYVFFDGLNPQEEKDEELVNILSNCGYKNVDYEALNGRYTIFDQYDNYEHAKRIADWKSKIGSMLGFIGDNVVFTLSDIAPDIGDRLWSIINAYSRAETHEMYSQVCLSCRRLIEYVSNELFPPTEEVHNAHKLGKNQFKNRLLAYADQNRKSETSIDLICISTEALNEQIEKLQNLVNKGIHDNIYKNETRRCVIRTILLLDDIISLKNDPFEIKPDLNFDELF